ncbi:PREDICTED: transposon, partial [Prunus dulcis]
LWPVIVVPYNLPHWMCMKAQYSMMTLVIPGPKAPSKDIDVYLRPLVDELKELWEQ